MGETTGLNVRAFAEYRENSREISLPPLQSTQACLISPQTSRRDIDVQICGSWCKATKMPNLQYIKCRQLRLDSYLLHIPFKMYLSPLDKKLPACNDIDISRINNVKNHTMRYASSIISEININTWRKEVLSREIFLIEQVPGNPNGWW